MTYQRRKLDYFLKRWKESNDRKPIIIKGARQIGKTASVEHFAQENYKSFININFVSEPQYKSIIRDGYTADAITKNISMINPNHKFIEGETLIFFDELQEFPEVATSLKFFNLDGRYDIICSGSLLGINYRRIESNSVGHKIDYNMYSMDFEEFLWAKGYDDSFIENMYKHLVEKNPFSDLEHSILMNLFLDYCIIGGMPEIINIHISSGTFEGLLDMQRQLVLDYQEDVRKYAVGVEQTRILNVFNRIPVQLGQDNKKFQISKVAHNAKAKDYWGCIEWLSDAGIINICKCLNFPELPLKGNVDDDKYKIYFADNGLLIALLDDEAQEDLRVNQNLGTYKGALYENIVAEAIKKSGGDLFYYKRQDSSLEEDFFLRTKHNLVPIEVKSTNGNSKSLQTLINSDKYGDITWGIKLIKGNIGYVNNVLTLPYFCSFLLKRYLREID